MAPVGMVGMLGWYSSPEVGIISLITFLILSVTLLALCVRCRRNSGNAYDVSGGATSGGAGHVNGTAGAGTKTSAATAPDAGDTTYMSWRNHNSMPRSTLE